MAKAAIAPSATTAADGVAAFIPLMNRQLRSRSPHLREHRGEHGDSNTPPSSRIALLARAPARSSRPHRAESTTFAEEREEVPTPAMMKGTTSRVRGRGRDEQIHASATACKEGRLDQQPQRDPVEAPSN